jgi:CHAT domain-containing protein
VELQERSLSDNHPDLAASTARLARVQAIAGDTLLALNTALRSARIRANYLRLAAGGLAERQALAYAAAGPTGLDEALALIGQPGSRGLPAAVNRVWEELVQTRTLVLDEMASRHRAALRDSVDDETAAAREQLRNARQRLANLLVRGPESQTPERYEAVVRRARRDVEQAERDLGNLGAPPRQEAAEARRGLTEVLASLPSGWGVLAFAAFDGAHGREYIAFLIGEDRQPQAIRMGDAERVDGLVRRWATAILSNQDDAGAGAQRAESAIRRAGEALRTTIWDPAASLLGTLEGLFIVPDGALHAVNFGALPRAKGGYLVEQAPLIHYLSSERDVFTLQESRTHGSGLLAIGGVDFGSANEPSSSPTRKRRPPTGAGTVRGESIDARDCSGFADVRFAPLPQSKREVGEIAAAWPDSTQVIVIEGAEASEGTFKRLVPGVRALHMATHGFFLDPEACLHAGAGTRGIGGLESSVLPEAPPSFSPRGPLLLSGLALAGANLRSKASPHEEDGILTAEEVASLDLGGVEWAVLSACDTGVSGASRGEGILGLRRAFQTAGVATLVMSLWPVQDEAAREWMGALYRARFREHMGTAAAVRAAMLEVLHGRRARGLSANPFFWAAFLAAGEWN